MTIKFVSYDGRYPNLCSGTLVLDCGGKMYKFCNPWLIDEDSKEKIYNPFWRSGGCAEVNFNTCEEFCEEGEWEIYADKLPLELQKYADKLPLELQKYADTICKIFNDNVPWGCCGGCI